MTRKVVTVSEFLDEPVFADYSNAARNASTSVLMISMLMIASKA
jgi:hypothetical protein